jgi:hypothetical protein
MARTLAYVRNTVNLEGFDYAFRHYSNFEEVKDPEFHRLREAYVAAAEALAKYTGCDEDEHEDEDEGSDD